MIWIGTSFAAQLMKLLGRNAVNASTP